MKTKNKTFAFFWTILILSWPAWGLAITTMSIQFEDSLRLVSLDMPRREIIETLGTPDIIKSNGHCLQYESLGLSIFLNEKDQVEQIYLGELFRGAVGGKKPLGAIGLTDIEREFGSRRSVSKVNYQPSPLIQTKATTETENKTDPSGKAMGDFPLQYGGNKKLYIFYNNGVVIKHKYVLDDEGIAFWLDHNQRLYATVLYTARVKDAVVSLPVIAKPTVEVKKSAQKIRLPLIHFDFDKYNIKKIYVPDLEQHVAYLTSNPAVPLVVEGHTDYIGTDQYNQKLSERRANAVRDYLVARGIVPARIRVVGYGEQRPIADNKTKEGRALNRRAEIEVTVEK